jgi:hypothetical protein
VRGAPRELRIGDEPRQNDRNEQTKILAAATQLTQALLRTE